MPLEILVIMVVVGVSGIAVLLHLTGRSEKRALTLSGVHEQWLRQYPDDQISEVALAQDCHSAIVITDQGPGLLWSFGADTVARHLHDFDVKDAKSGLTVQFAEYGTPRVSLTLTSTECSRWKSLMDQT